MKHFVHIQRKVIMFAAALGVVAALAAFTSPMQAAAAPAVPYAPTAFAADCPTLGKLHNTGGDKGSQGLQCFIKTYANPFIKFLAATVAVFVVISIVIGGIQYSTSADDPGKVSAAKKRIFDAVIALLAFLFMWAFLQWIVPGGVNG